MSIGRQTFFINYIVKTDMATKKIIVKKYHLDSWSDRALQIELGGDTDLVWW